MCHRTKCDCVCDLTYLAYSLCVICGYWCVVFTFMEWCMEGLRTLWILLAAVWLDGHADLTEIWHYPSTFLPFPGPEPHTQRLLSSLLECVYVCTLRPTVHNHCEGSGNSSRHIHTSPLSSPLVAFCSWPSAIARFIFPNAAAEDWRRADRGQAPERRGMGGWRKKENREGGSEGSFVTSSSCILVLL